MELRYEGVCLACRKKLLAGSEVMGRKTLGKWDFLCQRCSRRLGESSLRREVVEAVMNWHFNDDVGGPDDPLDHYDYEVLRALGLWPEERVET